MKMIAQSRQLDLLDYDTWLRRLEARLKQPEIFGLPAEVVGHIFTFLDLQSLIVCERICCKFREIIRSMPATKLAVRNLQRLELEPAGRDEWHSVPAKKRRTTEQEQMELLIKATCVDSTKEIQEIFEIDKLAVTLFHLKFARFHFYDLSSSALNRLIPAFAAKNGQMFGKGGASIGFFRCDFREVSPLDMKSFFKAALPFVPGKALDLQLIECRICPSDWGADIGRRFGPLSGLFLKSRVYVDNGPCCGFQFDDSALLQQFSFRHFPTLAYVSLDNHAGLTAGGLTAALQAWLQIPDENRRSFRIELSLDYSIAKNFAEESKALLVASSKTEPFPLNADGEVQLDRGRYSFVERQRSRLVPWRAEMTFIPDTLLPENCSKFEQIFIENGAEYGLPWNRFLEEQRKIDVPNLVLEG